MLANNKKAYYDYFVLEKLTAGIELIGCEQNAIYHSEGDVWNLFTTDRLFDIIILVTN